MAVEDDISLSAAQYVDILKNYGSPDKFCRQLCNAYAQLGARGTSVIFASGDFGVGQSDTCKTFAATFPATCP